MTNTDWLYKAKSLERHFKQSDEALFRECVSTGMLSETFPPH